MINITTKWATILLFMNLIACGGSKVLITPSEINQAKNSGTLEFLFDKAEKLKSDASSSGKKELSNVQLTIAKLLVDERKASMKRMLSEYKTEYGVVDKAHLSELKVKIEKVKRWDLNSFNQLSQRLQQSINQTQNEIDKTTELLTGDSVNLVQKMSGLKKIAILSGESSQAASIYQNTLDKNIKQISFQGREAYKKRMFNIAFDSAKTGLAIDPGNIQFESLLSQSEAALFEQDFRSAMENGKPELAYNALIDISDKPMMLQVQKKMKSSILLLANYFASNAQSSYQKDQLLAAYDDFKRGRMVQKLLSIPTIGFIQEKQFLDQLMSKVDSEEVLIGAKYGLLSVIKEFDPAYPMLDEKINTQLEGIINRATTKLSVSEFKEVLSSNSVVASVGRRVSSKLEKILFDELGAQLKIISELPANIKDDGLSGVVLSIDGEVLQAAIETSKNQGQRSLNVQTGINKIETEEYAKWKSRKRGDAPTQFIEEKIMEDVTIIIERTKKVSVAEVSYRIVEPSTHNVLLTNNIIKEAKHVGESTNEIQKGLFHQPYVEADLPSDIKIMDNLATELSKELGSSLLKYLSNPEDVFYQKYQNRLQRGELKLSVEMLSNAIVMYESKKSEKKNWRKILTESVLQN